MLSLAKSRRAVQGNKHAFKDKEPQASNEQTSQINQGGGTSIDGFVEEVRVWEMRTRLSMAAEDRGTLRAENHGAGSMRNRTQVRN